MSFAFYLKFGKVDGPSRINGSSKDSSHPGWIALDSVSWPVPQSALQWSHARRNGHSERGREKKPGEFDLSTSDPAALWPIMNACTQGDGFETVTVEGVKDGTTYQRVTMEHAYVASCQNFSANGKPSMVFILNFDDAEWIQFQAMESTPPLGPAVRVRPAPVRRK